MTQEKRVYHAEIIPSTTLRLESEVREREKSLDLNEPGEKRKLFPSAELIARLTERIKKL